MWIRSQSGLILVNTTALYIQEYDGFNDYSIIDSSNKINSDSDIILGTYKTEERALEVLNNIQELQDDMLSFQLNKWDEYCFFEKHKSMIYQMPEE